MTFTEYSGPTTPTFESGDALEYITLGPDGNLWFTENYAFGVPTQIGRITPANTSRPCGNLTVATVSRMSGHVSAAVHHPVSISQPPSRVDLSR